MPNLDFIREILWLLRNAEDNYCQALRRDPTCGMFYFGLAFVQRHLCKAEEANANLRKALGILNGAIRADGADVYSYRDRADAFCELGEFGLAVADLEKILALSSNQVTLDSTKRKIEEIRKLKQ